jgi:hypothetical protein
MFAENMSSFSVVATQAPIALVQQLDRALPQLLS